jgi:hypothetical protein
MNDKQQCPVLGESDRGFPQLTFAARVLDRNERIEKDLASDSN